MGRDVPARPIAALMKHLVVFEPVAGDFRYRLVGSIMRQRFGRTITGLSIFEVYDAATATSLEGFLKQVVARQSPIALKVEVKGTLGDVLRPQAILLPMKAADETTPWILMGLFYSE